MSASTRLGQYARLAAAPVAVAGTIAHIVGADIVFDGSTTVVAANGNGSSAATFADGGIVTAVVNDPPDRDLKGLGSASGSSATSSTS